LDLFLWYSIRDEKKKKHLSMFKEAQINNFDQP
jgi:hypothetical protein